MQRTIHAIALALASLLFMGTSVSAGREGYRDDAGGGGLSLKGNPREVFKTAAYPGYYSPHPVSKKRRLRSKFNNAARKGKLTKTFNKEAKKRNLRTKFKTAGDPSGVKGKGLPLPPPRVDGTKKKTPPRQPGPKPPGPKPPGPKL